MRFDISEIAEDFPEFRVAVLLCRDLRIPPVRSEYLSRVVGMCEEQARQRWGGTELSQIPGIAAWRRAYRQFGIKKTSYRSSVERLMKNVLAGRELPAVNGFVDAYNAVSLSEVLPAGADDLGQVRGGISFRYARPDDDFLDMAGSAEGGATASDPPKFGEVVYADAVKVLCRRWNWRQDGRSVIRPETGEAIVTLQSNGAGDCASAADRLIALLAAECRGRYALTLFDADRRAGDLNEPG